MTELSFPEYGETSYFSYNLIFIEDLGFFLLHKFNYT